MMLMVVTVVTVASRFLPPLVSPQAWSGSRRLGFCSSCAWTASPC